MKKLITLLIAVWLAGAAGISAQHAGDLTVLAAYNKQTRNTSDDWGSVNAGASYTLNLHRSIYFMPDMRLGWEGNKLEKIDDKFDVSIRADFAVRSRECYLPVYLFTGPTLDVRMYKKQNPITGEIPIPNPNPIDPGKSIKAKATMGWHVGLSFDFNPVSLKAAYGFDITDNIYKRAQYIEIALGWNFKL